MIQVGHKKGRIIVTAITARGYTLLCDCGRLAHSALHRQELPRQCKACYKDPSIPNSLPGKSEVREYTPQEQQMIKDYYDNTGTITHS